MSQRTMKTDRGLYRHAAVTNLLVVSLILLFAALSIALIVLGAQAYQAISETAYQNVQIRSTVGYVLSRIQAYDRSGAIRIEDVQLSGQSTRVMLLSEEIDGEIYETRMYCADGALREQTVHNEIPMADAQDGEQIAKLNALHVQRDGNLLTLEFTHVDGERQTLHGVLHSAERTNE